VLELRVIAVLIDKIKLLLSVLVAIAGVVAFYYLADRPEWMRLASLLGAIVVALVIAVQSGPGKAAWEFAKGSRVELRKVVWPSNKETIQVTLSVFLIVTVVALFLWAVDWMLAQGVQALTG
jgi:preprotein translocase subunit SecE